MNIFDRALKFLVERRYPNWSPLDDRWYNLATPQTAAGIGVNEESALLSSGVYACVKVLSETAASLPLFLFMRTPKGGKIKAVNQDLYRILHESANLELDAYQWKEGMVANLALWGNHYSWIERTGTKITGLWPLIPNRVKIGRDTSTGALVYKYSVPNTFKTNIYQAGDIFHVRLFSRDGITGLSPIAHARESIGLGLAAQEYGARMFSNGAQLSGVMTHPKILSQTARKNIEESFQREQGGVKNAWKPRVLEEGMTWTTVGMPAKDAQWIDARKFQLEEICRFYRVPPHMVQDLSRATNNNIEQMSLEFVMYTMVPWFVRIEQAITVQLLDENQRKAFYPKFQLNALLRGDTATRFEGYAKARQWGWMSANDIRELEDMDPIDGGDSYLVPMNMTPAGAVPTPATTPKEQKMRLQLALGELAAAVASTEPEE